MDNIIATVENLEKIDDVSALIALLQKSKTLENNRSSTTQLGSTSSTGKGAGLELDRLKPQHTLFRKEEI